MTQNDIKKNNYRDEIELKGYTPVITKEKAIEIARKKPFFRKEKGVVDSVMLLYKPFSLFHYSALIRHKKHRDRSPEKIEMYIAVDMITGLGFESEAIEPAITIRVGKNQVVKPLIDENKALNEAKRLLLKLKTKISKYGLEIVKENLIELGIVYKPIWIVKFVDYRRERETYVGVDALKGTRL